MSAAEDFAQYKLHFVDDIQHDYEVIRPIVLFAETIAERSRQTGIERTVVGAKARRFAMEGMLGLVDQRLGNPGGRAMSIPKPSRRISCMSNSSIPPSMTAKSCASCSGNSAIRPITTPSNTSSSAMPSPCSWSCNLPGLFRVCGCLSGPLDRRPDVVRRMEQTEHCWLSPDGTFACVCDHCGL